jgi:hypothetical protein
MTCGNYDPESSTGPQLLGSVMAEQSIPAGTALPNPPSLPDNKGDRPGAVLEPIALVPSRKQWWVMVIGGGVFFVIALLGVTLGGDTAAIIVAAFAGFWAVLGAIMLLPGANSLRLDENCFEIEHFFRRKKFRWSDVSDFEVRRVGEFNGEIVAFDTTESHLGLWERINGAMIGKKRYLPNTYGMTAEDLAKLLTAWKKSATDATS